MVKVDAEIYTPTPVKELNIVASVSIRRYDDGPIDVEEADKLVEVFDDKAVEFIEACSEEKYFACGSAGLAGLRTPEFHPDDRATDKMKKPFLATLGSEEEIEARKQREEEEAEQERKEEEVKPVQTCVACHVPTTQMDANQCPMCGNPF